MTDRGAEILAHAHGVPEAQVVQALKSLRARNDHLTALARAGALTTEADGDTLRYQRLVNHFKKPFKYHGRFWPVRRDVYMHEFLPQLARLCAILSPSQNFKINRGSMSLAKWEREGERFKLTTNHHHTWIIRPGDNPLDYIAKQVAQRIRVDKRHRERGYYGRFEIKTELTSATLTTIMDKRVIPLRFSYLLTDSSTKVSVPILELELKVNPHQPSKFQYTPSEEAALREIHKQLKTYKIR